MVMTENANRVSILLRGGELNRGGSHDIRNTLTPVPLDILSADISYSHKSGKSRIDVGVGYEELENELLAIKSDHTRAFVQWRYGF